jgi:hypothetical protein
MISPELDFARGVRRERMGVSDVNEREEAAEGGKGRDFFSVISTHSVSGLA